MTADVQHLLTAFDSLSLAEKQEAASALLLRISTLAPADVSDDALAAVADAAFAELDRREADDANR